MVDDHSLIRAGFRKIIEAEQDISIIGEAGNAKDFLNLFASAECDIVVLDINLPDKSGIELIKDIKAIKPKMHVLILSMYPEERYAIRCFKAGASGYISKEFAAEKMIQAIRKIHSGSKYVSEEFAQIMASELFISAENTHETLSDRELQILLALGAGKSVQEIARQLSLSINTINTYRARVLQKMNLKSNAEIIRYVIQNNLAE